MMCEHEFLDVFSDNCILCGKPRTEISLEQQLAAANARVAELRQEKEAEKAKVRFLSGRGLGKEYETVKQRAEQAEARVAELEEKCKAQDDAIRIMENSIADDVEKTKQLQRRAEQAEAQCAAMRESFEQLSFTMTRTEKESFKSSCYDHVKWYIERIMKPDFFKDAGTAILTDNQRMREALRSLIALCEYGADFRNGNVCQGIDEGNIMADRIIAEAKAALEEKP